MTRRVFCLLVMLAWGPAQAAGYLDTIPVFWKQLYPDGGESLYCGDRFGSFDRRYNIEHVFPMAWVASSLRCGSRKQCRRHSERFNEIESDMHNFYPSRASINEARGSMPFAEIAGERWYAAGCDVEIDWRRRKVEPRPEARGNIARAMLYMADTYPELRLYREQRALLERWHREDPPDEAERARSRRIERLQGRDNAWVSR